VVSCSGLALEGLSLMSVSLSWRRFGGGYSAEMLGWLPEAPDRAFAHRAGS
jgi:hypothetical protein